MLTWHNEALGQNRVSGEIWYSQRYKYCTSCSQERFYYMSTVKLFDV